MAALSGVGAVVLHLRLVVFLLLLVHSCGQAITTSPQDTTVFLDHQTSFKCVTTKGDFIIWKVNGTTLSDLPPEIQNDTCLDGKKVNSSTLKIIGRSVYNGTTVQCVTGLIGVKMSLWSEKVTLTIQGVLSSVVNLKTDSSISFINVSWSAPFTLNVTGVDPDIWYSVLIYNLPDEQNPIVNCSNLTQTHYTFKPDNPSPCDKYTFTIIPHNGAGEGENDTRQISAPDLKNYTILINKSYEITVHFGDLVGSYAAYNSTLYIMDGNKTFTKTFESDMDSQNKFQLDDKIIYDNHKYKAYIQLTCGSAYVNTSFFDFKTFDVLNAMVKKVDKGISITVTFINGSSALGSFIVMQSENDKSDHYQPLYRNKESDVISLPPVDTTYTVLVYDLEENGLPSAMPAIEIDEKVNVTSSQKDSSFPTSTFLKTAELSKRGSEVTVRCEFADDYPEASCILVYRKYNNPYLTVNELTMFPVTISINKSEHYTFAVFGKNGVEGIEEEPVITLRNGESHVTYPILISSPPVISITNAAAGDSSQGITLGAMTAACLVTLVAVVGVVAIIVNVTHTRLKKQTLQQRRQIHNNRYDSMPPCNVSVTERNRNVPMAERNQNVPMAERNQNVPMAERNQNVPMAERNQNVPMAERNQNVPMAERNQNFPMAERNQNFPIPVEEVEDGQMQEVNDGPGKVKEESNYVSVVTSSQGTLLPLKEDQTVQYQTIDHKATKRAAHPYGLLYAELGPPPPQHHLITNRIILEEPKTPYAIVLPHTSDTTGTEDDKSEENETASQPEVKKCRVPPTVEDLMELLYHVAVRWRDIAEGLGFVEHHIDEIFTNNETDVACLQDVMEQWMRLGPTWEKLAKVLSDIGEESLAQQVGDDHDVFLARSKEVCESDDHPPGKLP